MSNKKGVVLLIILAVNITLIFMLTKGENEQKIRRYIIGDAVPSFQLYDIEGKLWRFDELKGKVILINFWATWCDTCKMEKPYLIKLMNSMKDRNDIVFLTILYNDDEKKAYNFVKQNNYSFPVLVDSIKISSQFGVVGVPETVVIDKKGRFTQKLVGPIKWDSPEIKEALIKLTSS